ncbi:hypothetical protein DFQ27_004202 [Actinomortierella ambigua]|uniref:Uncharacterized protein n=1 Tax=Actinomortierella ambigua TaxID=1343610 RepID=A0A9P6Q2I8_9FUNG|nr:hypothetical protein DFQ27_004202 [Actinomortierella ambigua]
MHSPTFCLTFNVIGFPDTESNTFAVEINKKLHHLETSADTFPLWSANIAGVSASSGYRYVQLSKKKQVVSREAFQRHLADKHAKVTPNEFFDRDNTITNIPAIEQVYEDTLAEPSKVFDSSQVATIHITVDPDTFADMLDNPMDDQRQAVDAGFRFINADTIYSAANVKLKTSGHGSRKYQKVSLGIAFDVNKGETFFNRPIIKLRAEYPDKSMMHERLYVDILNSVGVPSYQASYVRVYVNGEPHGLYLMVEDIDVPYLMNTIHRGAIQNKSELGSFFKMRSGDHATMKFKGKLSVDYKPETYQNKILGNNPPEEPMKQFIAFMKAVRNWDPNSAGGIDYWKQRMDLDGFLKAMAVEYLTGAWDNFWWRGNNYFMYFNPQLQVWQFLPTDFDNTFGTSVHKDVDTTYRNYGRFLREKKDNTPVVSKLIYLNKDINKYFEDILLTITKGVFNSKVLNPRIDAYMKQIEKDVDWDQTIDRSKRPGRVLDKTMDSFHQAVTGIGPLKSLPFGIKSWIAKRAKSVPEQLGQ